MTQEPEIRKVWFGRGLVTPFPEGEIKVRRGAVDLGHLAPLPAWENLGGGGLTSRGT